MNRTFYSTPPIPAMSLSRFFQKFHGSEKVPLDLNWVQECLLRKQEPIVEFERIPLSIDPKRQIVCKPYPVYKKLALPKWKR